MKVSTKANKDADAVITNVTMIGGSPETWKALGMQALIVKLQGGWRKNGIPSDFTCNVDDYAPGTRHAGPTLEQAVKTLTPEERKALIAKLQSM